MNREKVLSILANPSKMFTDEWNNAYNELCDYTWKYRWHDLRKNPEDLPEDIYRNVIIAYEDFEEKSGYKYYDVAFLDVDDLWYSAEISNYGYHDEGFFVVAWREIEPFEEEE